MKVKIGSAGLGVVMGLLVFIIFTFVYGEDDKLRLTTTTVLSPR